MNRYKMEIFLMIVIRKLFTFHQQTKRVIRFDSVKYDSLAFYEGCARRKLLSLLPSIHSYPLLSFIKIAHVLAHTSRVRYSVKVFRKNP